jgi:hypothetical protein
MGRARSRALHPSAPHPARRRAEEMLSFFSKRGISAATLERAGVASEVARVPGGATERVIAFPYYK